MTNVSLTWLFPERTSAERDFATRTTALLQQVVNDPRFLDDVRNATYRSAHLVRGYAGRNVSGARVAEIIATGDTPFATPNGSIELRICLRDLEPRLYGTVSSGSPDITVDSDTFRACVTRGDTARMASIWLHEWMHVAGFVHRTVGYSADAPFVVGALAGKHVEALVAEPLAAPVLWRAAAPNRAPRRLDEWRCNVVLEPLVSRD